MHHLCRRLQFCSGVTQGRNPFLVVLVLDLVQVCGEEWVGQENSLDWNWGVRTGTEVAVLPPEIWAASVAVLSQDISALDAVLNCGIECMGLEPPPLAGRRNTKSLWHHSSMCWQCCHHITWITPHTPRLAVLV